MHLCTNPEPHLSLAVAAAGIDLYLICQLNWARAMNLPGLSTASTQCYGEVCQAIWLPPPPHRGLRTSRLRRWRIHLPIKQIYSSACIITISIHASQSKYTTSKAFTIANNARTHLMQRDGRLAVPAQQQCLAMFKPTSALPEGLRCALFEPSCSVLANGKTLKVLKCVCKLHVEHTI